VKEEGRKWSHIQKSLPERTENDIKNRLYNYLKKKEENLTPKFDFFNKSEKASLHFVDMDLETNIDCLL
jgi:hypothetical protein